MVAVHLRAARFGGQPPHDSWLANRSSLAVQPSGGWSGRRGSNPRPTAWKAVTLPLSYSRVSIRSLGHLVDLVDLVDLVIGMLSRRDPVAKSSDRACGGEGRIRTSEATGATDLQSVAFDRSATSPAVCIWSVRCFDVPCADRTCSLRGPSPEPSGWSCRRDLNPRPADYKSAALPG